MTVMKLEFVYGNHALVLPASVTDAGVSATANDWRVLCAFAKDQALCCELSQGIPAVAKALSLTEAAVEASLCFWRGAGGGMLVLDLRPADTLVLLCRELFRIRRGDQ